MSAGLGLLDLFGLDVGQGTATVPETPCVSVVDWGSAYLELAGDVDWGSAYLELAGDDEFGSLWRELEGSTFGACDVATLTITVPATRTQASNSRTVSDALLRQTRQSDVITGDEYADGFTLVVHVWKDNLGGLVPKEGMLLNDGTDDYEIREVSHDNRRQRYRLVCVRERG